MSHKRPTIPTRELANDEPNLDRHVLDSDHPEPATAGRFTADRHAGTVDDAAAGHDPVCATTTTTDAVARGA